MDDGKVVKVKNFDISVISISEAIEQMELLNHAFYVFVNKEDGKTCVLYRRNDGDYGLIETNA
jgi:putative sigma-54 modulation protein